MNLNLEVFHTRKVEFSRAEDESFCVLSHNLSAEDASQELDELGHEDLFAIAVNQGSHHAADDPDDCTLCRAVLATTCPRDIC